jgi:hypothetical protein
MVLVVGMKILEKIKNFDLEICWKNFCKIIKKEDLMILFTVYLFGFINYFYFLVNTVLSPDGLTYGPIYKSGGWEIDLGRPLLLVVDRLRGGLVSSSIIVFFALLYLSISVMIIRRTFPIKKKFSLFLISVLIALFPTFSESSLFIYCFDSYCFAFFSSILGVYFIRNKKYIFSILSIIVSLSLYQAYISVTITGVLLLFIFDILDDKQSIKDFIIQMFIVFIGILCYFIILKLGMFVLGRSLADYKGASSFGINTILSIPNSIFNAYSDFYSYFFLEKIIFNQYYLRNIINLILFVLMLIILYFKFRNLNFYQMALLILSLCMLPITINIMNLIACDTRINLVTAIGFCMFYLLFVILIEKYSIIPIIKSISIVVILVLCYTYLLSNNGTFQSRVDTYNHYYAQSSYILNQVKSLKDYDSNLPWMFNNTIYYQSPIVTASNGYLARDLETFYDYLGVIENEDFYRRFLGEKISVVSYERYSEIVRNDEYKSMKKGDIKIIDDVIVIKVSDIDI